MKMLEVKVVRCKVVNGEKKHVKRLTNEDSIKKSLGNWIPAQWNFMHMIQVHNGEPERRFTGNYEKNKVNGKIND